MILHMKIEMLPRIIDDNDVEVKENDSIIIQTNKMSEPSLAVVNEIGATYIVVTFVDVLFGNQPIMLHSKEIRHLAKGK